jgi:hypothetical protein
MNTRVTQPDRPFEPGEPHDAMAETFRRNIVEMVVAAPKIAIYRDMSDGEKLSAFMSGALTALIGVAFASVKVEARDIIMQSIETALPMARKQAEDIIANARSKRP